MSELMEDLRELGLTNVSFMLESGVYILVYKGEIMYVGKSRRLMYRILDHHNIIPFDEIHIMLCEDAGEMEASLIERLQPRYNRTSPWSPHHPPNRPRPGVIHRSGAKRKYNATMSKIVREARGVTEEEEPESIDQQLDEIRRIVSKDWLK